MASAANTKSKMILSYSKDIDDCVSMAFPKCKNKILQFDTQRILRAYEVKKFTNKSLYDWVRNTKSEFNKHTLIKIYLDMPREKLLKRIYFRTTKLLNKNCFSEVKNFNKLKRISLNRRKFLIRTL